MSDAWPKGPPSARCALVGPPGGLPGREATSVRVHDIRPQAVARSPPMATARQNHSPVSRAEGAATSSPGLAPVGGPGERFASAHDSVTMQLPTSCPAAVRTEVWLRGRASGMGPRIGHAASRHANSSRTRDSRSHSSARWSQSPAHCGHRPELPPQSLVACCMLRGTRGRVAPWGAE